jgi:acetylornithine deacetylase/succinyl-diaminopimelate desuccinylase-like protein
VERLVTVTVNRFLSSARPVLIEHLTQWTRIASISGVPERAIDLMRSAHWLAETLRETGFPTVEIWNRDRAPAVYADWSAAPGAPTVLVYSHHDVRPAIAGQWEQTAPFSPVLRRDRLYARGASDAKGQVLAHLWGLRAHLAATGRSAPAVNLKLLVEGEEETGSPDLSRLLHDNAHRLGADLIVYSDTLLWTADDPAVCVSMRGLVSARLEVYGSARDIHGGAVSGPAPNPAIELGRLLGRLHDDKGRVTLPGFYDSVVEASPAMRAALARLPFTAEDWLARTQTYGIGGETGYTVLERLWTRPAVEVLALTAGDPTPPSRGVMPAVASAELTIHLVPDQTTDEVAAQLRHWVSATIGDQVDHRLTVHEDRAHPPYVTPVDHPAVEALSQAMGEGFGAPAGRMGNAGGGPAPLLAEHLGAPVVFFGTGLIEDRWHAADESVSINVLLAGAATLAHLWARLAHVRP